MYQRIRDLREDRDLTQKNMGEILNCSQRIYSNYECGDVDIPTHILIKLAEFHNTSVQFKRKRRKPYFMTHALLHSQYSIFISYLPDWLLAIPMHKSILSR